MSRNDDLSKAAFDGDVDAVARRLDAGANIDESGSTWSPLHAAIAGGSVACVRLLVRRGANVERLAGELSPLAHAVDVAIDGTIQMGGNPGDEPTEVISLLLEAGADPTTALQLAQDYRSPPIVNLLTRSRRLERDA